MKFQWDQLQRSAKNNNNKKNVLLYGSRKRVPARTLKHFLPLWRKNTGAQEHQEVLDPQETLAGDQTLYWWRLPSVEDQVDLQPSVQPSALKTDRPGSPAKDTQKNKKATLSGKVLQIKLMIELVIKPSCRLCSLVISHVKIHTGSNCALMDSRLVRFRNWAYEPKFFSSHSVLLLALNTQPASDTQHTHTHKVKSPSWSPEPQHDWHSAWNLRRPPPHLLRFFWGRARWKIPLCFFLVFHS